MRTNKLRASLAASLGLFMAASPVADACTRVTYLGPDQIVVTGRSMDWMVPIHSNLWAFPAGLARDGAAGANSLTWTSRYGSVITAGYDAGTTDGMNVKGLVANLLYLGTADYGQRDASRPGLSVLGWTQYVLDSFATVNEAVEALKTEPFQLIGPTLPGGFSASLHLSISDASGDSAVLEYINGKLVIHHGRQYQVMTNDPTFDQQLALNAYWQEVGGKAMLPGTARAADRFVRASYYLGGLPKTSDQVQAVAGMFSVMRDVSVPFGVSTPDEPNIAPTLWRTVADQTHRVYYFESTSSPDIFWVEMDKLDLSKGQPTRRLAVDGHILAGETSAQFTAAQPFAFVLPLSQ